MSAIRTSPFFNNPAFAQAAQNLSSLFAPPSGADAAGWAEANAKNAAATRLAEAYAYAKNPNYDPAIADRENIVNGSYNPTQSWQALSMDDATKRRGQDITADTAITNNRADNQRAVVNSAFQALSEGQVRPEIPSSIAEMYRLPQMPLVAGVPKPLSTDELNAQNQQQLQKQGLITTQDLVNFAFDKGTPVQAVGPQGKPVYMSSGAAVRSGAQPYEKPAGGEPVVRNFNTPDGKTGSAMFDAASGNWVDTASKQPLPAGTTTYTGQLTGDAASTGYGGGKPTEASDKAGQFYNRAAVADANMNDAMKKGYQPNAKDFELMIGGAGDVLPLSISNALVSPQGQQFYNQAMSFMMSTLRPDTGAAFGKKEFQDYSRIFIPLPGDTPATIADKAQARATALAALSGTSRGAADAITQKMIDNHVQVPPEMLAHMRSAQTRPNGGAAASAGQSPNTSSSPQSLPVATPKPAAVEFLRQHPEAAADFDRKFGAGAADRILGAR